MLPILPILGVADLAAMGYSYITKGTFYGIDYYLTGHDIVGEGVDWIFDRIVIGSEPEPVPEPETPETLVVLIAIIGIVAVLAFLTKPKSKRRKARR